jgi:glutamyl-tRNA synthetase
MKTSIVTRIAPSPTGHLHIGTARTALINYLFARAHGGTFIIRSEDTDRARSTKEYEAGILEGLEWLGFEHDAFYRQSERGEIYRNHLETLIETGKAYLSKEESKATPGTSVEVVRLKNEGRTITFRDEVRGEISFDTTELGDFVIARSLNDALYHFTVVVDDFLSNVTHVIRGEDHISNTPRQILIQEAIGAPRPLYAHLPLILASDRSKMSKRHGATSIAEYRAEGFIAPAVINYLALLGWNPGTEQEIFTLSELIEAFDLSKIQKGGAVFDREKFLWFNREHIRLMSDAELIDTIMDVLPEELRSAPKATAEGLTPLLPLIKERVQTLRELKDALVDGEFTFVFAAPPYDTALLKWKKDAQVADVLPRLKRAHELLTQNIEAQPTMEEVKAALWDYAEAIGRGELLWPLRVALSGKERSADPFTIISIIGREESLKRILSACDRIEGA